MGTNSRELIQDKKSPVNPAGHPKLPYWLDPDEQQRTHNLKSWFKN